MARFSRGAQINDSSRQASREQRQRQISDRNRALRREKQKKLVKKLVIVLVVIAAVNLLFDRQFVRYDQQALTEPYKTTVDGYFHSNPLRRSKIFFDTTSLSKYVLEKHPELQVFNVELSFFKSDKFSLSGKQAAFIWQTSNGSFLGDESGVVFAELPQERPQNIATIRDASDLAPKLGEKVVSAGTLEYIGSIEEAVSETTKLTIKDFLIPVAAREVHVFVDGANYFIKFSLDRSVAGQVSELAKVENHIKSTNLKVNNYIDLRTPDRVYYR